MIVRGYLRVSHVDQAESGLGLAAQRTALQERAERRGDVLERVYEDHALTGRNMKRPALQECLSDMRAGEALMFAKIDRVARSVHDFSGLIKRADKEGWVIICLDPDLDLSTPNGRLVANVLASVAQWESEIIGQRIREALAAKTDRGEKLGRPWMPPETAEKIRELRAQKLTYRAICERLTAEGVPTPRGGSVWRPSSLEAVLG